MLEEMPNREFKMLLGRAFLMELERGDREKILLFARAFLLQLMADGVIGSNAS